ncbi:MAG: zinc ribbon domain-containing protein [Chloroflexi bacterium]|nr:zinc ribbon domain-containing protein [Chloroflexota bacterium]
MLYCPKCGNKVVEGGLYCSACGNSLEQVVRTQETAPVVSTEEQMVKTKRGKMDRVANCAIMSALVGAVCGLVALALTTVGLYQQYDLARNRSWATGAGGLPSGSIVAGTVLAAASTVFIAMAIALGIYALRSARKE